MSSARREKSLNHVPRSLEFVREAWWDRTSSQKSAHRSTVVSYAHISPCRKTKMGKKQQIYLYFNMCQYLSPVHHCLLWEPGMVFFRCQAQWALQALWLDPSVDARIPMTLGPRTKQSRPRPASVGQSWHTIGWPHLKTGEWFGTMKFYDFPYWEFHHPNWRSPSFFRGLGIPPTSKNNRQSFP